jgi:hypothetical protein
MDTIFENDEETERFPPENVRFEDLHIEPWPDGFRIKVFLRITPFLSNPDIELVLTDPEGNEVSRTRVIETPENSLVLTMHIRAKTLAGSYTLSAALIYPQQGTVDNRQVSYSPVFPPDGRSPDLNT